MRTGESATAIEKVRDALAGEPGICVGLLFGSVASGKMSDRSDADVAVLFDHPLDASRKLRITQRLEKSLARPVDLIDLFDLNGTILKQILCRGVLVIRNNPRAHSSLIRRMIYDQADLMPYVRRTLVERQMRFIHG